MALGDVRTDRDASFTVVWDGVRPRDLLFVRADWSRDASPPPGRSYGARRGRVR